MSRNVFRSRSGLIARQTLSRRSFMFLHRFFPGLARQVEGHVDVFLDIAEALLLEEVDRRLVVGGCVDDHHPYPLLFHAVLDLLEQTAANATLLNILADPQPDKITVFPG